MDLIIVRHAEAEHNAKGLVGGWSNTDITKRGMQQADRTGERLCQLIDRSISFLSSDLLRARRTAEILAQKLGQSAHYHRELRELKSGDSPDNTATEDTGNAVIVSDWDWKPYPDGESWRMMHQRIWAFLDAKLQEDHTYLIVSHANAMVEVVNWFLRLDADEMNPSYDFDNCSITTLRINRWKERTIHTLNDTMHLC